MQYRINERPKYKLNFYSPEEIFFLNLKHKVAFSSWNDNFNSMIVRLKDGNRRGKRRIEEAFQFYDSPIKSNTCYQRRRFLQRFQFYDSLIKRQTTRRSSGRCWRFQFYDSPIKSPPPILPAAARRCFNSMIVRLKVDVLPVPLAVWAGFNSMIVRLKGMMKVLTMKISVVSILW